VLFTYLLYEKTPKDPSLLVKKENPNVATGDSYIQDKIGKIVSDKTQTGIK
jgi:hypothetical protein